MIEVGRVAMVPVSSVIISDRARQEMGDLNELESSMKQSGLITPLTMKDNGDGTYQLLAGERRFLVIQRNGNLEVPARLFDRELNELEMKIIEKSENFYRKDFEYWEYDKLVLDITRLEQQLQGAKGPGPSEGGHSLSDTGDMLGVSKATVSLAIKRAELREQCPELFEGCKTASDATAVIKKMDEALIKHVMAQKIEEAKATEGGTDKALINLAKSFILNDFFVGIREIPPGVFHLVEIDPPYAIAIKEAKRREGESQYVLEDYNEVPESNYMNGGSPNWNGMNTVFKECYRVMAEHSWLICWFAPEPWFGDIYNAIIKAGFETTRLCPIWTKPSGQTKRPEMHLPNSYEMFFYAWKGRPAIARQRGGNEFSYSPIPPQQKVHPTERPIDLIKDIYETFAFPGSRVLIPFLGSGNGLISAYQAGMTGIGFELGKGYRDSFLCKVHGMK